MCVGVTDVNLHLVSAIYWLCGLGFLICEKQNNSNNKSVKLSNTSSHNR